MKTPRAILSSLLPAFLLAACCSGGGNPAEVADDPATAST